MVYESKIREDFQRRQEAVEQRLHKEEKQKQLLVDEVLAKKLQEDEELQHKRWMEQVMEEENRLENLGKKRGKDNLQRNSKECRDNSQRS